MDLRDRHPEDFRRLDALIALGDELGAATSGVSYDSHAHMVTYVLYIRMIRNVRAAALLLAAGFGVEAGILARSLVGHYIDLCYLLDNATFTPDELAARFFAYQAVERFIRLRWARDEAGKPVDPEEWANAQRDYEAFERTYLRKGYGRKKDWSGVTDEQKARDGHAAGAYRVLYTLLSEMTHGGPLAWRLAVIPDDREIRAPMLASCSVLKLGIEKVATLFGKQDIAARVELIGLPFESQGL